MQQINHRAELTQPLAWPFSLTVGRDNLICAQSLRYLAGKRLTLKAELAGKPVVAKLFFKPRISQRHFLRELRGLQSLKAAGIATPEIIYHGKLALEDVYIIVTQWYAGENGSTAWQNADAHSKQQILCACATLLAQLHGQGLQHHDLHLGNLLLTDKQPLLLDGADVGYRRIGKVLSQQKSVNNLALLFAQLAVDDYQYIDQALLEYCQVRQWSLTTQLKQSLQQAIHSCQKYRQKKYLKKIFRSCTAFRCEHTWQQRMIIDRTYDTPEFNTFLTQLDTKLAQAKLLKNGNSATLAQLACGGQGFVVKRYNIKNYKHGLRRAFQPSRAAISWRNAHCLTLMGVNTAKPVALIEKRYGPLRSTAYFIMEYIPGAEITQALQQASAGEQAYISQQVSGLISQLFTQQLSHGDMKATNFLWHNQQAYIIDLDAMQQHRSERKLQRAIQRDKQRFLQNWQQQPVLQQQFQQVLQQDTTE